MSIVKPKISWKRTQGVGGICTKAMTDVHGVALIFVLDQNKYMSVSVTRPTLRFSANPNAFYLVFAVRVLFNTF